jgi:hypothetical protein
MMGELAQRLAEAAKHARISSKDGVRVLIGVEEHGIRISASGNRWGDRLSRKDITFIEVEQCRFNMLINAIDKVASEVRTADSAA